MTAQRASDGTPTPEQVARFSAETLAAIAESRRVRTASDWPPAARTYSAVADELRPLLFQVAEMAEHEPDNLRLAAEYLHGLLEREPLRSSPFWAPQTTVLGLFLLGLTNALARIEAITADERAALRPGYMRDAEAAVTRAFDPTYIPPPDEPEGDALPDATAPETTDADLLARL
jgi:hypothetical protein